MKGFRADLHIHTVLSPCGDLEMSPVNIVRKAKESRLDIIGITDHNSTRHCKLIRNLAEPFGIMVMMGAEITTKEEIHCLAFFETDEKLDLFQSYLEMHLPHIPNDNERFGYQPVVDHNDMIIDEEKWLLISALDQSIDETEAKVHSLDGLFIPAHVDKPRFSLLSQLGFIPDNLQADAFEVSGSLNINLPSPIITQITHKTVIKSSDAHRVDDIGNHVTVLDMEDLSFLQVKKALSTPGRVKTLEA